MNRDTVAPEEPAEVLELLDLSKQDWVAMVGFFRPLVEEAKCRVGELLIFEKAPDLAPGFLPAHAALEKSSLRATWPLSPQPRS